MLLAIVLSIAVFFVWYAFFVPKPPEKPIPDGPETTENQKMESGDLATEDSTESSPAASAEQPPDELPKIQDDVPARKPRLIKVSTPLYTMTLSEKGAAVVSMVLEDYRESVDPKSKNKELISEKLNNGTLLLDFNGKNVRTISNALYQADIDADTMDVTRQPAEIRFRLNGPNGVQLDKVFTFQPDSYLVGLSVSVINRGQENLEGNLAISLTDIVDDKQSSYAFQGPAALINNSLEQIKLKKIKDADPMEGEIRWLAIESRYFMTSIVSSPAIKGKIQLAYNDDQKLVNQLVVDHSSLAPGHRESYNFDFFMGPKSLSLLRSYNNELDRAIHFGMADVLAKPCLWFMKQIYRAIPNYGVAIIILTIITRMIFWPLATKSYKSMGEMRKLQPLMQEIREKYKDDKQQMNKEMMDLYRTYKINPLGGCLPMLIQLPVFFALYRMLYQAIELRHAPFIWWINDLSAPDRLFHFDFKIPFMQEPYGIPVLTLVMAATMLLQQKMTPTPGDPAQAKMMMFLPMIFLFIFINFSSGLVLYWLVSNVVSIAQQYYINKKVA